MGLGPFPHRCLQGLCDLGKNVVPKKDLQNPNLFKNFLLLQPTRMVLLSDCRSRHQLYLVALLGRMSYLGKGIKGEFSLVNYGFY